MRVFICSTCRHELPFESMACPNCDSVVGYVPERRDVVVLVDEGPARYTVEGDGRAHWRCLNASWGCNWMLPADGDDVWCLSCRLTRGRPDESDPAAVVAWSAAEAAKRRLVFQLGELGLPIQPRSPATPQGLAFDLVHVPGASAVTGHDRGLITLDLSEADERHRDELRRQLGEPFRTLIGHLRHEVGHYYFAHLVSASDEIDASVRCSVTSAPTTRRRSTSTIEAPERPSANLISAVSSRPTRRPTRSRTGPRPLPITCTHATACRPPTATGCTPAAARTGPARRHHGGSPTTAPSPSILERWLPVAETINAIADGLGSSRPYPFTLSPTVVTKLEFVHARVMAHSDREDLYAAH